MSKTACCTYTTLPSLPTIAGQGRDNFQPFARERLLTVPEVGEYLHVGERPIYKWIAEGRLVASWIGRSHLISESDLARFVENQKAETSWHQKARETAKETN